MQDECAKNECGKYYSKVVCRSLCDMVIFEERSKGSKEENLSRYLRLNHSLQRELTVAINGIKELQGI